MRKFVAKLRRPATILSLVAYTSLFGFIAYQNVVVQPAEAAAAMVAVTPPLKAETVAEQGRLRAAIGMQEYAKHPTEQTRNCNCGPIIDTYTQGHPGQWCTMFASWVANEAGTPVHSDKTGTWRVRQARDMMHYLQAYGQWTSAAEARQSHQRPQPGDYIFYYHGQWDENLGHVSLVISSNGPAGTADVLNGNNMATITYDKDSPYETNAGFLGFGRPLKQ